MDITEAQKITKYLTDLLGADQSVQEVTVKLSQDDVSIPIKVLLTILGSITFVLIIWSQIVIQGIIIMAIAWFCGFVAGKEFREYTVNITKNKKNNE